MSLTGVPPLRDPDGLPLFSLREVNSLPPEAREGIYGQLLPTAIFRDFLIDADSFSGQDGRRKVEFQCPKGLGLLRVEVRLSPADADCLFFIELADTPYHQLELSFCLVNDPGAPRFGIDRDAEGVDNSFGTLRRNLQEEVRAMAAGLSPHQVRRGLNLFAPFFHRLEHFVARLGMDTIVAEPLSYSNAIRYEGHGFDYIAGKQLMLTIDREFRTGGELWRRLDGSSPFRQPGMGETVRGRSWAIHDGILGHHWDAVSMYKVVGRHAGVDTFPDRHI